MEDTVPRVGQCLQHMGAALGWHIPIPHFPCSTRLEMGKWMEDLNVAIEMAKKSTEKSEMLLENSVCNRSNSKCCSCLLEKQHCPGLAAFPFVSQ